MLGPAESTEWRRSPATAKMRPPAVLTMSGSSTPASWTLVPESPVSLPPAALSSCAMGWAGSGPPSGARNSGGGEKAKSSTKGSCGPAPGPRSE